MLDWVAYGKSCLYGSRTDTLSPIMPLDRIFLGWRRPLCETVPEHLLSGADAGMLDLRGTVVVVPTRQSSWRLRASLPLAAHARGVSLLGPEMVTPPVLLDPPQATAVATALDGLLAWTAVLQGVKPGEGAAFLGAREGRTQDANWALQVARRLQDLRRELADGGLSIADVTGRGAEIEESERWAAMADLERRYAARLADWGLRDERSAKLEHARRGSLAPDVRRVVVAAVPDPPKLLMALLGHWADAGGVVEVLVAAPEEESAAFDAWGRPLPDAWQARGISLRSEDLWLDAAPSDQAVRIAQAIRAGMPGVPADSSLRPMLAIGAPDRETVAPLQRELAAIGMPAFDPQNRPFSETALFTLVQSLLALNRSAGYVEVAALLRHPDVLSATGSGCGVLRALDAFQSMRLPVTIEDMRGAPDPLRGVLDRLQGWRERLRAGPLAQGLRAVLQEIYERRLLRPDDPADAAFQQAVAAFDAALRELEAATDAGRVGADPGAALLARLQEVTVKAERRDEAIDLEGWLELAWNPAPLLFVAGMNEGFVPDGHVGDFFLPDALRRQLDLRDDRLRVARDACVLTALLEQRRVEGRVILLVGRTSTAGDPLRPSRLLFRCPDGELVARARQLFQDPPPVRTSAAYTVSFKLDPNLIPAGSRNDTCSQKLSVTGFRTYLACPLRFYLQNVLGMQPLDDRAREPDALTFGIWVHEVLSEMGRDPKLWACGDAAKLADWLERRLDRLTRDRYGARPWLGIELAKGSAARRLRAFAEKQVAWNAEGWEIVEQEKPRTCNLDGMTVSGRVDRIDRNARTGAVCVLDYKTTDKPLRPDDTHSGPALQEENLPEAIVPAALTGGRRDRRWADLQLPLYRELVRADHGSDVRLGYVCLPNALGATGFACWEAYNDALHESAMRCAVAIVGRIRQGAFWPPGKIQSGFNDPFEGVLLGDPEETLRPPAPPWRARL